MINNNLISLKNKIEIFQKEIEKEYKNIINKTQDDERSSVAIEHLLDSITDTICEINFFKKDSKEGYLEINSDGRFTIANNTLTCGCRIELYIEKYQEWNLGRIESSDKFDGYYFFNENGNHQKLEKGMKARIRF